MLHYFYLCVILNISRKIKEYGFRSFFVSSAFHLFFVYRQFGVCTVLDSIDKSLNMLNDMQFLEFHFFS